MQPQSTHNTFESLYLKERKRAQIFMTLSIVLAILLAGSIIYHLNSKIQSSPNTQGSALGEVPNSGQGPVMMGRPGGGSGGKVIIPQDQVTDYLNPDGSVNTDKISSRLNSLQGPPQMIETMLQARAKQIDEAEARGEITSQQAEELKKAWGIK
ncbi:MAG: hypothetical protein IBX64_11175 [Actinobacteria bacterium]|nr:hypothetical protein [Actinomycetota bacterium]